MPLTLQPLSQRLHPLHQLTCVLERPLLRAGRRLPAKRPDRLAQILRRFGDVVADLSLERIRVLRRPTAHHALRELDLVLHPLVADRLRRLAQPIRGVRLLTATFAREPIRFGLQPRDVPAERILAGVQIALTFDTVGAGRALHLANVLSDLTLPLFDFVGALGEFLHALLQPGIARILDPARRPLQFLERCIPLGF